MKKQNPSQEKGKNLIKKQILTKQPQPQVNNKPVQKVHTDKYVLEPITTVSGQRKFKKYEKLQKIGKGTYSQCFLVKTVGSDSYYALKIIPKNKLQVLIRQKLIYEIKIQQQLSHPNVVYLDHWFEDDDFQYIFMEYCSKGNLETKLQQMTQLPQKLIRFYCKQIVESLMYIHSKGILHRDLKLCNFYLDQDGNLKLGDFGFACQLNHVNELKRQTCGTPNYIAPQAISGFGYSYSADVWAIGVILFRLKFAYCPFEAASVKQTLQNVKLCKYTFPKGQRISSELKDLIAKIFNINYDQRLTLQQIMSHPFFQSQMINPFSQKEKELKKQKRGFSLSRLFSSSKQKGKKQSSGKIPPKEQKNVKNGPVRSNSCQTFKKIKQTFKQKNLMTLVSSNTMPTQTQQVSYIGSKTETLTTLGPSLTMREIGSKNVRQIIDSYNPINGSFFNDFSNKGDRNSRLTQFLAKQHQVSKPQLLIKKQMKVDEAITKKPVNQRSKNVIFDQLLIKFQKKYIFPSLFTFYKDIIIVSFMGSVKFLIYSKQSASSQQKISHQSNLIRQPPMQCQVLILYRNKYCIYNIKGERVEQESLSKVLNYVIEKKITFEDNLESQEFFSSEQSLQSILHKLPNLVLQKKQGILMIYGTRIKGYYVAKSHTQELFYLASLQQKKLNTLFKHNQSKSTFEVQQGPVLTKIYSGWTQQLLTNFFDK